MRYERDERYLDQPYDTVLAAVRRFRFLAECERPLTQVTPRFESDVHVEPRSSPQEPGRET